MHNDADAILDDLLRMWHEHTTRWRPKLGYPGTAAGMDGYRASRQYDDTNGALEDAIDRQIAVAIEHQVSELPGLQRVAIGVEARRLAGEGILWGSAAWLPQSADARAVLIVQARGALVVRLMSAGVM